MVMNRLEAYLRANRIRQTDFAKEIGVRQPTVSRLAAGKITPSLSLAIAIERVTMRAVPISSWTGIDKKVTS